MTDDKTYVALKPLRFGADDLAPGDPVPYDPHRNYPQMLRLGQIVLVGAPGAATTPAPPAAQALALHPLLKDQILVWVAEDGKPSLVTFDRTEGADEDTAQGLGLAVGDRVAVVVFMDDHNPGFVRLDALLPGEAGSRLMQYGQEQATEVMNTWAVKVREAQQGREAQLQALHGDVAFLELLLKALKVVGEPLPLDFPALEFLQGNGLDTLEGLQLLVVGEQGYDHLIRLDGIGKGRAGQILTALAALAPAPVADAAPPAGEPPDQAPAPPAEGAAPPPETPAPGA